MAIPFPAHFFSLRLWIKVLFRQFKTLLVFSLLVGYLYSHVNGVHVAFVFNKNLVATAISVYPEVLFLLPVYQISVR